MERNRITHITTREAAPMLGVEDETMRRGLCINGHYLKIKPVKLPNRRLLWPLADIKKILEGENNG